MSGHDGPLATFLPCRHEVPLSATWAPGQRGTGRLHTDTRPGRPGKAVPSSSAHTHPRFQSRDFSPHTLSERVPV